MVATVRLGAVCYLNAVPLVHGLDRDPGFAVVRDVPSRVAERLHAGELDLGMIPSIEYVAGEYAIVPGMAIASRGPVSSVSLFCPGPLSAVRRVALDASSRTSAALVRVVLREELGRDPEYVSLPPDVPAMLGAADAALVIGDAALYYQGEVPRLDLGGEWTRRTGLPFVWAFWAGRPGAVSSVQVARLQQALADGLAALSQIAWTYNGAGAAQGPRNEAYLRSNMRYRLGEAERAGLAEFYTRAHAAGVIPRVPELSFHGTA